MCVVEPDNGLNQAGSEIVCCGDHPLPKRLLAFVADL
jgi:hypothetical protein